MKTQKIDVAKIILNKELYPRHDLNWAVKCRYYNAMKAGAKFPPLCVAELEGKYVLVDGNHRLNAYKDHQVKQVECEVLTDLTKQEIYVEAVKRNVAQGQPFSTYDTTKVILDLKKWNISLEVISEIISMPVDSIEPFVVKRTTSIIGGEEIALKSPLKNLASIPIQENPNDKMGGIARTQLAMIEGLIALIKNQWVDYSSENISKKMNELYGLLEQTKTNFLIVKPSKVSKVSKSSTPKKKWWQLK